MKEKEGKLFFKIILSCCYFCGEIQGFLMLGEFDGLSDTSLAGGLEFEGGAPLGMPGMGTVGDEGIDGPVGVGCEGKLGSEGMVGMLGKGRIGRKCGGRNGL